MRRTIVLMCVLGALHAAASAQWQWGGIADFAAVRGGTDSRADRNGLPNDSPQLLLRQLMIWAGADLTRHISATAQISSNIAEPWNGNALNLQIASVTFADLAGDALAVSVGRILTPFGTFAKRQLGPDNPVLGRPLFFELSHRVSPQSGYLDAAGLLTSQNYGGRLSTMYVGAYYTGVEAFGSLFDQVLDYDVALMNGPLSSTGTGASIDRTPAVHGRIALHPGIWGTIGASLATGAYLQPASVNQPIAAAYGGLEKFRQTTGGLDLQLGYLFYELNAEYLYNRFDAPYIVYSPLTYAYRSGLAAGQMLALDSQEILIDLKVEAPFTPGVFLAFRYDQLLSGTIRDPDASAPTFGRSIAWEPDAARAAVALGYKPEHGVLLKVGYETTDLRLSPRPELDVYGIALAVTF